MSLIKCPECGREISDRAPHCIHCGFPLNEANDAPKKSETSRFYTITLTSFPKGEKPKVLQGIRLIFGYGLADAVALVDSLPVVLASGLYYEESCRLQDSLREYLATVEISPDWTSRYHNDAFVNSKYAQGKGAPRRLQCPRCRSLDVELGTYSKTTLMSLFINTGPKVMCICRACGAKFSP